MENFIVREDGLYLNDEPFKLLSGAIHYFRIPREQWYRSLYNLKALGFNTVETYTAWNLHEPKEGVFDFSDRLDLKAFIELAQSLGLYVIVRPSPYICAEWEFGGLPAWLLTKENVRLRANDPVFLQAVERYYQELFQILTPLQITHGGPIIMMQIENEYGSYSEDKTYLRQIKALMEKYGADVTLFTADGAWQATLRAGSLLEDKILATGNFGSHAKENFAALKAYQEKMGVKQPLICMEFWDGWFSRWGEPVVKRDQAELLEALREVLTLGAGVNLYMFHGGTNFGFMNGCSARREHDLPQITSYDYGAPLNEAGEPTPTYYAIQELISEMYPELEQKEPLVEKTLKVSDIELTGQVDLFTCLDQVSEKYDSQYPQSLEELGSGYGYVLYRTQILRDKLDKERFRVIDARDRLGFYLDGEHVATQYQEEIGADIEVKLPNETGRLDILVENMGRVNYGSKLLANTQRKGLGRGVMADLHFILGWEQYVLDFDKLFAIDFTGECVKDRPGFYRYEFELTETGNCYLDLSGFGKGIALVNGHNLWTTKLNITRIMVVDDEVSQSAIEKSGLKLATPAGVKLSVLPYARAAENILAGRYDSQRLLIVAKKPHYLLKLVEAGVPLEEINVGNMSQSDTTTSITRSVNVDEQDVAEFKELNKHGVHLIHQMVPADSAEDFMELLNKKG